MIGESNAPFFLSVFMESQLHWMSKNAWCKSQRCFRCLASLLKFGMHFEQLKFVFRMAVCVSVEGIIYQCSTSKDFHGPTMESVLLPAMSSSPPMIAPSTTMQRHTGWTWIRPNSANWLATMPSKLEYWSSCTWNILIQSLNLFRFLFLCEHVVRKGSWCSVIALRTSSSLKNRQGTRSKSGLPEAIHGACWWSSPSVVRRLVAGRWLLSNCPRLTWSWRMSKVRELLSGFALQY